MTKEGEALRDYRNKYRRSLSPQKLLATCLNREKKIEKMPGTARLHLSLEHLLFGGRLFHDAPVGSLKVSKYPTDLTELFKILAAPTAPLKISRSEWRYRKILTLLKKPQDMEFRWLLIARWLKQERVCEPKQFLPQDVCRILIKRFHAKIPMSATVLLHRALIRNWQTYFVRIREETPKQEAPFTRPRRSRQARL